MAAIKQPRLLFGSLGRIHISRYGFHGHCKAVLYTIYAARRRRLCVRAGGVTAQGISGSRTSYGAGACRAAKLPAGRQLCWWSLARLLME